MNVSAGAHSTWAGQKSRAARWLGIWARCVLALTLALVLLHASNPSLDGLFRRRLQEETQGLVFNFVNWEWHALVSKVGFGLAAPQDTLTEAQRQQLVVEFVETLGRASVLHKEIEALYSRLEEQEAARQGSAQVKELERLHSWLVQRQGLVEGILEEQVSTELEAEGLGRWGTVWPPVKIRFTELPLLLVVSARAEITREVDVDLEAGLPVSEREAIEARVDSISEENVSLVTPIGGLSAYPAMILEFDSLVWLADTFAHEWTHHWLVFHPLGMNYNQSGEMASINETTANIVGREIGRRVILRFYGELAAELPPLPVPPESPPMSAGELVWPEKPPAGEFDFNREMRITRLRVDDLLAEGRIEEAEAYMEERRLVFVANGHDIRKLNQAYFAFYGSYATSPSTANPIGGQLEWLRAQNADLREFMDLVSSISRPQDLLDLLSER